MFIHTHYSAHPHPAQCSSTFSIPSKKRCHKLQSEAVPAWQTALLTSLQHKLDYLVQGFCCSCPPIPMPTPQKKKKKHTQTHTHTHTHIHTHTLASCNVDLQKPNTEEPNAYCVYVQHLVVKLKRASSQKSAVCVFYSLSRIINETVQKCKTYNFSSFTQTGTPVAVTYDPNLLKPTVNARC